MPPLPRTLKRTKDLRMRTQPELMNLAEEHARHIEFDGDWAVLKVGRLTYCAPCPLVVPE